MLWSCPVRAQRPIVSDVKWTFEAASKSTASEREIQSVGDFDIGQSAPWGVAPPDGRLDGRADEEPESDDPLDPEPEPDDALDPEAESDDALDPEAESDDALDPEPEPDDALDSGSLSVVLAGLPGALSFRAQPVPLK
jgi:hypothetical protein